jgi:hypothetical protein
LDAALLRAFKINLELFMVNSIYRFMLFKLRKSLELSQLCELFDVNAEMESELESCLNIISDELLVPSHKLRPTDRFNFELIGGPAPQWLDDFSLRGLLMRLEIECNNRGIPPPKREISTVGDFIHHLLPNQSRLKGGEDYLVES